jgi:hypothetical protein
MADYEGPPPGYNGMWNGSYYQTYQTSSSPSITITGGTTYVNGTTSGGFAAPPPRELSALEWLDAEVEKVCALAR